MLKWLEKFEVAINWAVLLMMAVVVLLLTTGFAIDIWRNVSAFLIGDATSEHVFATFGNLLLILIGLELMHTVKVYLQDHTVHVEVILAVALVALARKVIGVNPADLNTYQGSAIIGLALLIAALAGSHWLLLRRSSAGES
jgi:uncharacterized membrane protein (DUF373 family)